jgi:hypothetical protein
VQGLIPAIAVAGEVISEESRDHCRIFSSGAGDAGLNRLLVGFIGRTSGSAVGP